jgi:hypothetical protein
MGFIPSHFRNKARLNKEQGHATEDPERGTVEPTAETSPEGIVRPSQVPIGLDATLCN